jgi:hypothetical protein
VITVLAVLAVLMLLEVIGCGLQELGSVFH